MDLVLVSILATLFVGGISAVPSAIIPPRAKQISTVNSANGQSFHAANVLNDRGNCFSYGISKTEPELEPWLQLDLGSVHSIHEVKVKPQTGEVFPLKVLLLKKIPWGYPGAKSAAENCGNLERITGPKTFSCRNKKARYILIKMENGGIEKALALCKVDVTGEKVKCGRPNPKSHVESNVRVEHQSKFPGSTAKYSCAWDHKLEGASQAVCSDDGLWQMNNAGEWPSCKKITCPAPRAPTNGIVTPKKDTWAVGDEVTFSCQKDYDLQGINSHTCRNTGRWSHSASPTCTRRKCPSLTLTSNLRLSGGDNHRYIGSERRFICSTGYKLQGDSSIQCQSNAQWSGQVPSCQKIRCRVPEAPEFGQILGDGGAYYDFGTELRYMCNPGYTLEGSESRTCGEEGQWTRGAPTCKVKTCRDPGVSEHAARHGDTFHYGSAVSYTCSAGYVVRGSATIVCQMSGHWTATRPTCEAVVCPSVISPRYGNKDGDVFTYGAVVDFSCYPGYKLVGSNMTECQSDRTWSSPVPACIECPVGSYKDNKESGECITCPKDSTTITSASTSRQHCRCNTGFEGPLGGPCTAVICEQLSAPENGHMTPCSTSINSVCEFRCDAGYVLKGGNARRRCGSGGWSGNPVSCQACPPNYYTIVRGSEMCTPCPRNSITEPGTLGESINSCKCSLGYFGSAQDGCIDINECMGESPCEQECVNTPGSYRCRCNIPGHVLKDDGKTCLVNQTCKILDQNPEHGNMDCTYTPSTNGRSCYFECDAGYFFVSGRNNYVTCGKASGFVWSHQQTNSTARLPSCTREFFVDVQLTLNVAYHSSKTCDQTETNVTVLTENLNRVVNTIESCNTLCEVYGVTTTCENLNSTVSKILVAFDVLFPNVNPKNVPENCTSRCQVQNMRNILRSAQGMKLKLGELVTTQRSQFEEDRFDAPTLDTTSFKYSRLRLYCEEGNVLTKHRLCVPCDRGYYLPGQDSESCLECPKQSYQDQTGQSSCKRCPDGTTTLATGAYDISMCSHV